MGFLQRREFYNYLFLPCHALDLPPWQEYWPVSAEKNYTSIKKQWYYNKKMVTKLQVWIFYGKKKYGNCLYLNTIFILLKILTQSLKDSPNPYVKPSLNVGSECHQVFDKVAILPCSAEHKRVFCWPLPICDILWYAKIKNKVILEGVDKEINREYSIHKITWVYMYCVRFS